MNQDLNPESVTLMRDWFKFFLEAGGSVDDLKNSMNSVRMERILGFIRSGSPDWVRKYPERNYSTLAYGSLEENQFLLDFSGEEIKLPKICFVGAPKSVFFEDVVEDGVYLITLSEKKVGPSTPFPLNLALVQAHWFATGERMSIDSYCKVGTVATSWQANGVVVNFMHSSEHEYDSVRFSTFVRIR